MKSVSFVVLNWNGEKFIPRCLEAILEALAHYQGQGEVLAVDNGSRDGSVALIQRDFPRVRLISLKKNLGFSEGNNIGVQESRGDIVVLVNNDAYIHPNFLVKTVSHFEDDRVFSVTPKVCGLDGKTFVIGRTGLGFKYGLVRLKFFDDIYSSPVPCLWSNGGSGLFDRGNYLELGGLLDLLYWEDTELGYRAWKRKGWKTVYEPESLVYHDHGTSYGKLLSKSQLKKIRDRNRFLFQWYITSDPWMIFRHVFFLPFLLPYYLAKGKGSYPGFCQPLWKWRQFKKEARKRVSRGNEIMTDRQILRAAAGETECVNIGSVNLTDMSGR